MTRTFLPLILSLFCLLRALPAAPEFLTPPLEDALWRPPLDSATCQLVDLNGTWNWSEIDGTGQGSCRVPSCYSGTNTPLVFERSFRLPPGGADLETSLLLGGVNHSCRVEINGKFIGAHANGSTSLELPIPHGLLQEDNRIRIRVDRRLSPKSTIPLKVQNWDPLNYGGIYRELYLVQRPRLRVEDLNWRLEEGRRPELRLRALLRNTELVRIGEDSLAGPSRVRLQLRLLDGLGEVVGEAETRADVPRRGSNAVELTARLKEALPWSPEDPVRYELQAELYEGDLLRHRVTRPLAFRRLGLYGGELRLNGERLRLQGVEWVAEHPASGIALSPRQMARDLEYVKNLGANLLLATQGAVHPQLIEYCNRNGMLLIQEMPAHHVPRTLLAKGEFQQLAGSYLKEMLLRDRQEPSLLAISLGSGYMGSLPETQAFIDSLMPLRQLAPQLLLTAGLLEGGEGLRGLDLLLHEDRPGEPIPMDPGTVPVVVRGIGLPVEDGNQEGYANPWSALRQARHVQQRLLLVREQAGLDGSAIRALADWRGGRPLLWPPPGSDRLLCPMGLMTAERATRAAYHEVQSIFGSAPGATLTQGEHSPVNPLEYPMAGFLLLILMLVGLKQNKVFAQNLKRSFVHSHGFFSDIQNNRIYQFGQSLFIGFLVCYSSGILLSSLFFYLRKNLLFDHLLSQFFVLDLLKENLAALAWQPLLSMLYLGTLCMALALALAVGLRILGLLFNARFSLAQCLTFLAFSGAPLLFFILLGSVLYRLLQFGNLLIPLAALVGFLLFWTGLRLLRSMRIAFAGAFLPALLLLLVILTVAVGLLFAYYENNHSILDYLQYYLSVYQL